MSEVVFVLKSFAVTIAVIFLMQIKVGRTTVQHHVMGWMNESVAVDGLRYVAEGAVSLGNQVWNYGSNLISSNSKVSDHRTESASRGYSWESKSGEPTHRQKRRAEAKKKAPQEEGPLGPEVD